MKFFFTLFAFMCVYRCSAVDIMPELKRNILDFGYRVNFKYEEMVSYSFDRFYVVTKYELLKVEDLKLTTVPFDFKCSYLTSRNHTQPFSYFPKPLAYFQKIVSYVEFYKKQIGYYNCTAYKILKNKIGLILFTYPKDRRHKRVIIGFYIRRHCIKHYRFAINDTRSNFLNEQNQNCSRSQAFAKVTYHGFFKCEGKCYPNTQLELFWKILLLTIFY